MKSASSAARVRGCTKSACTNLCGRNDIIRVDHNNEDVNLSVVKLMTAPATSSTELMRSAIRVKEKLSKGDLVYKTRDYQFYKRFRKKKHGRASFGGFQLLLRVYASGAIDHRRGGLGVKAPL